MLLVTASISATFSGGMGTFILSIPTLSTYIPQTLFDIGQATLLKEHTQALSVHQAIAQSRKSRGLLDTILRRDPLHLNRPTIIAPVGVPVAYLGLLP